jgi:hypothetical protein
MAKKTNLRLVAVIVIVVLAGAGLVQAEGNLVTNGDVSAEKDVSIFPICPGGYALEFIRGDDYVKISDHDSLSFANEVFSVSTWFETTAPSSPSTSSRYILYKGSNSTNREYFLCLDHSGRVNARIFKSGSKTIFNDIRTDMAYDDGGWHFAAITSNGDELNLYVDGVLKGTASVTVDMANLGSNLYIGLYGGGTEDWYGYLDEVAIYNRALSTLCLSLRRRMLSKGL